MTAATWWPGYTPRAGSIPPNTPNRARKSLRAYRFRSRPACASSATGSRTGRHTVLRDPPDSRGRCACPRRSGRLVRGVGRFALIARGVVVLSCRVGVFVVVYVVDVVVRLVLRDVFDVLLIGVVCRGQRCVGGSHAGQGSPRGVRCGPGVGEPG